jgi:stage IV sporulation protein FB
MDLAEALAGLDAGGCPALPVLEPISGRLVGLLTTENVGELLMVRAALRRA